MFTINDGIMQVLLLYFCINFPKWSSCVALNYANFTVICLLCCLITITRSITRSPHSLSHQWYLLFTLHGYKINKSMYRNVMCDVMFKYEGLFIYFYVHIMWGLSRISMFVDNNIIDNKIGATKAFFVLCLTLLILKKVASTP